MFLEVLRKEMLLRRSSEGSKAAKVGFFLARVAFMALFLAVLVLIVLGLDTKIQAYSPYGSFDFLVLLLFILLLEMFIPGKKNPFYDRFHLFQTKQQQ